MGHVLRTKENAELSIIAGSERIENTELSIIAGSERVTSETVYVLALYTRAARSASAVLTRDELIQHRDACNQLLND